MDTQPGTPEDKIIYGDEVHGDKVAGNKITYIYPSPEPIIQSVHQLPSPSRDFTGREAELDELTAALGRGATITGLRGMGGIGKTALALKLADGLIERYPDAQFYLDLRGTSPKPLTPAEAMAHIIRAYHPTAKLPESQAELEGLYRSVLHGQCALLLMDNAADRAQVEPLLPPASCLLLVTSRQHFTLPGLYAKDLNVMLPNDAQALLLRIAERINGYSGELARLCGYLPLALRAAASLLAATPDLAPAQYADELRDERTRLECIGTEGVSASVEASLNMSYQRLNEASACVFRLLAVFPGSFDTAAEEVVCEDTGHRHLSELVRYSLVDWNESIKRYNLHDLTRLFAEARMSDEEHYAVRQRHAAHYETVLRAGNDLYTQGDEALVYSLALFDLEWPNIETGFAWATTNAEKDNNAAQLCMRYPDWPYLLELRLRPQQRIHWFEAALAAARRLKDRTGENTYLGTHIPLHEHGITAKSPLLDDLCLATYSKQVQNQAWRKPPFGGAEYE
ncbi:MAG: hypothetical protein JW850_09720, partial [Thermoflexales bacterium]|nr:hypothetical protein [Thermoflexales bacterium]